MDVRVFEGQNMTEIAKIIKRDLGNDAVILDTRSKKDGSNLYEVVAASEAPKVAGASRKQDPMELPDIGNSEQLNRIESHLSELKSESISAEKFDLLYSNFQELEHIVMSFMRNQDTVSPKGVDQPLYDLYQKLKVIGMEPFFLKEIVKHCKNMDTPESKQYDIRYDEYKERAIKWMLSRIRVAPKWLKNQNAPIVQAFAGDSGTGKTSLIWKIAKNYKEHHGLNVLVVSVDNHSVGINSENLSYSKIFQIPHIEVNSGASLQREIDKKSDVDLVLVDVKRLNFEKAKHISLLKALKSEIPSLNFNLVLSAATNRLNLDRSIRQYSPIGLNSLSFTKLDESWVYGDIFCLSHRWSIPLSFFSNGAKIPEDLERATKERVIEKIFEL